MVVLEGPPAQYGYCEKSRWISMSAAAGEGMEWGYMGEIGRVGWERGGGGRRRRRRTTTTITTTNNNK